MKIKAKKLSVAGATIWFAFCYGGAILGYLVINGVAARLLVEDFGQFVIAVTVTSLLGQMALMGAHRGGLREAARLIDSDSEGAATLPRAARAVSLLTLPAFSLGTTVAAFYVYTDTPLLMRVVLAASMGALVWFGGQQKLWANYLRGYGQVRFASLLEGRSGGLLVSLFQAFFIFGILLLAPEMGLSGAMAALAAGYVFPVLIAWRRVSIRWLNINVDGNLFQDLRDVVIRNWHFASNLVAGSISAAAEIWLAGLILSAVEVSQFSAAQRLSVMLSIPFVSLGVVFSPVVSRLAGHDDRRLESLLRTAATAAGAVTALAWIPMLFLPAFLLQMVYGPWFSTAAELLVLLSFGSMTIILSGLSSTALTMSRHEAVVGYVQWMVVAARVVFGAAGATVFGAVGLAASDAAVTALHSLTLWILARKRLGLRTHPTLRPAIKMMFRTRA